MAIKIVILVIYLLGLAYIGVRASKQVNDIGDFFVGGKKLGFWLVSVPFAILLGGATAFLSLLPYVGPVVWVSVVLYLLAITGVKWLGAITPLGGAALLSGWLSLVAAARDKGS